MKFSEFCDMTENTEQEQKFLQFVHEEYKDVKEAVTDENAAKAIKRIPFVGKLVFAMAALADCQSLADFRQTEYYADMMDCDIEYNAAKEKFTIQPSAEQKLKAAKIVLAVIGAVAALMVVFKICRACRRRRAGR